MAALMGALRVGAEAEVEKTTAEMRAAIAEMETFTEEMVEHAHVLGARETLIAHETDEETAMMMSNQEKTVVMVGGQAEVQSEKAHLP